MANEINNQLYDTYGDRWYSAYDDPVALLRAESKTKVPWVLEKLTAAGISRGASLLDVGCGGGFLSNALAEKDFTVTGVDISADSLLVAARHDRTGRARYVHGDAYALPFPDRSFAIVTAMDFLEHVEDPARAIREISRVLQPGGLFFYHTFNRNPIAGLLVIKMVEWLVANTPKNMHLYRMFLKPREVEKYCRENGMEVQEVVGLRPIFSTIPIGRIFSGVVPESLTFKVVRSTLISYMGYAKKPAG